MVAVSTPDVLSRIRLTVDEYLDADLPEGWRYELVGGVVQVTPVPGIPHDSVIEKLNRLLVQYAERRPDVIAHITQRSAVTLLDRSTAREPDFAVYAPSEMADKTGKTWKDVTPSLVVEVVSPGHEARDDEEKRRDYWDAGIAEYWIADPDRRKLTVLARARSEWNKAELDDTQVYRSPQFPELEVDVAMIFRG
jgi:Uma2 family endonuclease